MDEETVDLEAWRKIENYEPLLEVYGYWPTFHDATVEKIESVFGRRELIMTLRYSDLRRNGESLLTVVKLRWNGVTTSELTIYGEDLMGINFYFDQSMRTEFEFYPFGFHGEILSAGVSVEEFEVSDPTAARPKGEIRIQFK